MHIKVLTSVVQMAIHESIDLLKMCLRESAPATQLTICGFPLALSQQGPLCECTSTPSTSLLSALPA